MPTVNVTSPTASLGVTVAVTGTTSPMSNSPATVSTVEVTMRVTLIVRVSDEGRKSSEPGMKLAVTSYSPVSWGVTVVVATPSMTSAVKVWSPTRNSTTPSVSGGVMVAVSVTGFPVMTLEGVIVRLVEVMPSSNQGSLVSPEPTIIWVVRTSGCFPISKTFPSVRDGVLKNM